MRISTRSRYGIRLMINLSTNFNKGPILLKEVAREEDISEKYLSLLVIPLKRAGFLTASRGVNGGYCLAKKPSEITVGEVVEVLEGDLQIIDCIENENYCQRKNNCASYELWKKLGDAIAHFLNSFTMEDLVNINNEKNFKSLEYII